MRPLEQPARTVAMVGIALACTASLACTTSALGATTTFTPEPASNLPAYEQKPFTVPADVTELQVTAVGGAGHAGGGCFGGTGGPGGAGAKVSADLSVVAGETLFIDFGAGEFEGHVGSSSYIGCGADQPDGDGGTASDVRTVGLDEQEPSSNEAESLGSRLIVAGGGGGGGSAEFLCGSGGRGGSATELVGSGGQEGAGGNQACKPGGPGGGATALGGGSGGSPFGEDGFEAGAGGVLGYGGFAHFTLGGGGGGGYYGGGAGGGGEDGGGGGAGSSFVTERATHTSVESGESEMQEVVFTYSPAPDGTGLTTSLSGDSQAGTEITVPDGTAVSDSAELGGANAALATGTVTYKIYSNEYCTDLYEEAGAPVVVSSPLVDSSAAETLPAGTWYWQASYSGDSNDAPSLSPCGSEVETVLPYPVTVSGSLTGGGHSGGAITVSTGGEVSAQAQLHTAATEHLGGYYQYIIFADSGCTEFLQEAGGGAVTGTQLPSSSVITLPPGVWYWQAVYEGDDEHSNAESACGSLVERVEPPAAEDTLTGSLTGGGQSGESILVPFDTPVTDTATLTGPHASQANGKATYSVFSDGACTQLVAEDSEVAVSAGAAAASSEETLGTGTYYWRAFYSGEPENTEAAATRCGAEIETVAAAQTSTTASTATSTTASTASTTSTSTSTSGIAVSSTTTTTTTPGSTGATGVHGSTTVGTGGPGHRKTPAKCAKPQARKHKGKASSKPKTTKCKRKPVKKTKKSKHPAKGKGKG